MSNPNFVEVQLFGGAMTSHLPRNFFDASNIRQIPDNQELYLDRDGLSSIVIDLGERVAEERVRSDEQAFGLHIEDIADPKDRLCVGDMEQVTMRHLPGVPAYSTMAMTKLQPNGQTGIAADGKTKFKVTAMLLLLVRLAEKKTDICITVNMPFEGRALVGESLDPFGESRAAEVDTGVKTLEAIRETFQIKDWDLFVEDQVQSN